MSAKILRIIVNYACKHIKFSGFRKGVRGITLFPPEKGFPRIAFSADRLGRVRKEP